MNRIRPTARKSTGGFMARPPSESAKARLTEKCILLRHNDPETTTFDDVDVAYGYLQKLGGALVGNTHVSTMRLQVWKILGLDEVQAAQQQKTFDPLLDYLGTGPALCCLHIHDGRGLPSRPIVMDLLLSAVQENSNVEELDLFLTKISAPLFQTLLPNTKSLTTLSIGSPVPVEEGTVGELDWVRDGITSNTSLEIIQMDCSSAWSVAILTGLVNKGGDAQHLTKLTLKTPSNVTTALWDALTAYLRLEAPSSPLQELALVANGMSDNVVAWTAADLVPLLCLPTPTSNDDVVTPTVGSQIQSLSVSPRHSCLTGLYQGLADHAARIRIQKLNVAPTYWQTARENVASLALCIVKVSSLRHLEFVHFLDANGDLPATTVASLKESGHVQSVSANVQSKIVHAYCNRNRILAQLLLESSAAGAKNKSESPAATATAPVAHKPESMSLAKRTHSEMDGRSDKAADDESGGATTNSNKKLKLSLLPKLFKSAMQMPRLRPSMLTRTLLRLQESIVPTASSENKGALEMAS